MRLPKLASQLSVFLLALFLYPSSAIPNSSFHGDAAVLISMKASMVDPNHMLHSWRPSNYTTHCSWTGIKCDHIGRVVALNLFNMNISGPFPTQVTKLPALRVLNVSYNFLTGNLPSNISVLRNLEVIDISSNILNGSLPSNISNLRNLEILDASFSNLSGALPLDLHHLLKLRNLDLAENYLSGSIPVEYGKLKNVEYLTLNGNSLSGRIPGELGNLRNLKALDLSENGLSGQIPGELGNLGNLKTLHLSENRLSGQIPGELGNLRNLKTLDLSENGLSGQIPGELGNLRNLKALDLSMNTFDGALPSNFGDLKSLEKMFLYSNGLTGPIPPQLGHLVSLKYMYLFNNSLSGEIPVGLSELNELGELDLSLNKLTGSIPPQLGHLVRLKRMILSNNSLSGEIPVGLSELNELEDLDLSLNKLTGSIPPQLGHLVSLQSMSLIGNTLFGEIPAELSQLKELAVLLPSHNRLNGRIPSFIGDLPYLEHLFMEENNFTGPLPQQLGGSRKLLNVDVSSNRLTGSIPPSLCKGGTLAYIDISQNEFSGPLPVEIARLSTLSYLNVSRNQLNGSIPTELDRAWLYPPDFSYNKFSGFVENGSVFSYLDRKYFVGNPYLCGAQLNPWSSHVNGSRIINLGLVLALVLLFWLLVFGIGAVIIKARAVKKQGDSKPWMMTTFQKLNFESDDILECIKEENIIGKGGSGVVYRGMMPKGEQVAVKKLMGMGSSNDHGFSAEIETLGRIRHRHIVRLMAICSNHDTNLLVYEYMSNGSLGELLHGNNGRHDLHWNYRYKIALEAAKGLCYLHHHCVPLILHRDVKSSNILLDSNFEAHVADFGLAMFLHRSDISEYMSSVAGTFGYIAPEYANALKVDVKSDVYSYGVVVLELITGKRPVGECEFEEDMNLVGWVKHITKWKREEVMKIMDSKLSSVPIEEAMHLLSVALLCIQEHPHHRPTMRDIVHILTYFPQTKPMESF